MIAAFRRQLRGRFGDLLAIALLTLVGTATLLGILSQQKAALPGWIPVLGQQFVQLKAEFSTGQALMPGQGQAVTISGVQVGKLSTVDLEDGKAVVGLNIEPKFAGLIHKDAELLLRPKTNLNDMVIDVEPGTGPELVEEGDVLPLANTAPNVNPEEFINTLDGDTQEYLRLLLGAGAEGLQGAGGEQLGDLFRQFYPFVRDVAKLNTEVAKRRRALSRVIHNFGLLTEELGRHDSTIMRWVSSSSDVMGAFADEADSIENALVELPSTLRQTDKALTSANQLSKDLGPTLAALIPQAQALGPALDASAEMFREATGPIRDQIRPFTREVMPTMREAQRGSAALGSTVKDFGDSAGELNGLFNLLAYNPGEQNPGYLFYLPWMNHTMNANYTEDAAGPMRRSVLMVSCRTAYLAEGFARTRPFLQTLIQATNLPNSAELRPILQQRGIPVDNPATRCGAEPEADAP